MDIAPSELKAKLSADVLAQRDLCPKLVFGYLDWYSKQDGAPLKQMKKKINAANAAMKVGDLLVSFKC